MSPIELVREFFPEASQDYAEYVIWNHTGYPSFYIGEPEAYFRRQIRRFKRAAQVVRGRMCELCNRRALSNQWQCRRCKKVLS